MASKDWKEKNYNKKIKVSEATVAQLRKGSKAENIAKANKPGASAEYKEAVRRFYGKTTVKASGSTRPTGKITPRSRGGVVGSKTSQSKPAPRKTSNKSPIEYGAPKANMNTGSKPAPKVGPRKTSAKRQTILQKAGINTTAIATALVPTGKAIQGIKTVAGAAKYGKVVSRNLNNMQRGYTRGVVTKKELDQAKKLAEAVAKRKQQLKSGSASAKPKANSAKTQQMAKEMLEKTTTKASGKNRKLAKKSVAATGAAYVSKKLKDQE